MTTTETTEAPRSTDDDAQRVHAAVDALLDAHDPRAEDAVAFRGAQYDAGLAWVHFPPGYGGMAARPALQREVERRLRAAGASERPAGIFFGHYLAAPTIVTHGSEEVKQ